MTSPSQSAPVPRQFLATRGITFRSASLEEIVSAVLDFYGSVFFTDLVSDHEADGLLFQYGIHRSIAPRGSDEVFMFCVVRQFTTPSGDDVQISQLHCILEYQPVPALQAIGERAEWCFSRDALVSFSAHIFASDAFREARLLWPWHRGIFWERV